VKNTSVAYLTMHVECFVWRPRAFAVVHCGMWGVVSMDTRYTSYKQMRRRRPNVPAIPDAVQRYARALWE